MRTKRAGSSELFPSQWLHGGQQRLPPDPLPSVPPQLCSLPEEITGKDLLSASNLLSPLAPNCPGEGGAWLAFDSQVRSLLQVSRGSRSVGGRSLGAL